MIDERTDIQDVMAQSMIDKSSFNKAGTNFINQLDIFFGRINTFVCNGTDEIDLGSEPIGPISVDPRDGDLYAAWENELVNKIQNYKNQEGKVLEVAVKEAWLSKAPGVLCFQVKRALYNIETAKQEKNNDRFTFHDEIFIDRFLLENRSRVNQIRSQVSVINEKINKVNTSIEAISNYGNSKEDLTLSLSNTLSFLTMMASGKVHYDFPSDLSFQLKGSYKKEISTLNMLLSTVKEEKMKLTNEKNKLVEQATKIYSELDNNKYKIFSIIIHEGTTDYGHYYALIKDGDQWFKFNDYNVSKMEESEVFNLAYGGTGNASAYCIFYAREGLRDMGYKLTHKLLSEKSTKDEYNSLVPIEMRALIEKENEAYQKDLLRFRVDRIISSYSKKVELLRTYDTKNVELIKQHGTKKFCPSLCSIVEFGSYMVNLRKYDSEYKAIFKWLSLNEIVTTSSLEYFGKSYTLENIYENHDIYQSLTDKLSSLNADMRMTEILLDSSQGINLSFLQSQYDFLVKKMFLFSEILDQLYACNFKALFEASFYFSQENPSGEETYYEKAGKEFISLGVIKCFYLFLFIYKNGNNTLMPVVSQGEHLEALANYLSNTVIKRTGYSTQLLILIPELLEVLPKSMSFVRDKLLVAQRVIQDYKNLSKLPQISPNEFFRHPIHITDLYSKLAKHKKSLNTQNPNDLEKELKEMTTRLSTEPNTLLRDDNRFLKLHTEFIKKTHSGARYEQVINILGNLECYFHLLKKQ